MSAARDSLGVLRQSLQSCSQRDQSSPRKMRSSVPEAAGSPGESTVCDGCQPAEFPRIAVQFEVRRPDGSFLLDATRDEFRVTEEGKDVEVARFPAPRTTRGDPHHHGAGGRPQREHGAREPDRALKQAVASFLEKLPEGSRVAVVGFGSEVERLARSRPTATGARRREPPRPGGCDPLLRRRGRARHARRTDRPPGRACLDRRRGHGQPIGQSRHRDRRRAGGWACRSTRSAWEPRKRSPAPTSGGWPTSTRGQYYPARNADQLRAIYETIADRIGASYSLVYESDRRLPDGTLRPVRIFHRGSSQAGETAVFIPGMVVPAGGWSPLFLGLLTVLAALA